MTITSHLFPLATADWEAGFNKKLTERDHYALQEGKITYTQVAGTILGAPLDHYTYKEFLYQLVYGKKTVHLLQTKQLDKQMENKHFQSIQRIMNIHKENNGLSVNRFTAFMEGENLFPLRDISAYYVHLRQAYMQLLRLFNEQHEGLLHADFQRMITDTVKWSWNYVEKWVKATDYTKEPVQVIWYGDASISEVYFLYFLILLGFDVLVFHPEGKNIFSILPKAKLPSFTYPSTLPLEPFPTTKPTRVATVAEKASAELNQILHADGTYLFKPWQFREYLPEAITLHTTYDEVRLITKERAFIRPSFEVANQTVHIPVIFAKICGISKDRQQFAQRYKELIESPLTLSYHSFPFTKEIKGNQQYHYEHAMTAGELDPQKMVKAGWWRYSHLPQGLQLALANAIARVAKKRPDEAQYIFTQGMEFPLEVMQLLQRFDYSQDVPKLVLFNNGKSGELSRADAARLLILNELGVDIVLFNPTAQNDLERFIDAKQFDHHWLEDISFEESHEKQLASLRPEARVRNLFNKLISKRG